MNQPAADDNAETGPRPAVAAGIGAVLLMLAVVALLDSQRLPPGSAHSVGPAAAVRLVAAFVGLLGVAHLVTAWRQRHVADLPTTTRGNHAALAWVLGALVGLMLILQVGGGFVLASAWLFALTARAFGAPLGAKSIAIGVGLSATVFLFFTKALSLGLPTGPLERLVT